MSDYLLRNIAVTSRRRRQASFQYRLQQGLKGTFAYIMGRLLGVSKAAATKGDAQPAGPARPDPGTLDMRGPAAPNEQRAFAPVISIHVRRSVPAKPTGEAESFLLLAKAPSVRNTAEPDESDIPASALAGLRVLCVGGRAALYPAYRRLIEVSGGHFLVYRGDPREKVSHLPTLLASADAIICPIDCVNHTVYFAIKRYCVRIGKPCVMLERSGLPTFRRGVEMLAAANP